MKKLAIAVIHYHLRPGGVTRVIERAVESLGETVDLLILSGEAPAPNDSLTPLSEPFGALEYSGIAESDPQKRAEDLRFTARCLLGRDPDIWHIHNHSLGKNSFMPQLVRHLAEAGCRLLLQPHDFAEDGRPENYRLLREQLGNALDQTLYPTAEQIWYAPINSRDQSFLETAGLQNVHLLPNAVTPLPPSTAKPPSGHRTFVYPARAIRRKNMGEFILWSLLAPAGDRFISTLAPQNPQARPVYDQWVAFAQELQLPVEFDAGRQAAFSDLVNGASALATTSIAEGFGLAFLEPWLEGKVLVGRKLPEITSDFEDEGLNLSTLYDRLPVPIKWAGETQFKDELEAALKQSYQSYSRHWNPHYLEEALQSMIQNDAVDFGVLSEPLQRNVIRHLVNNPEDRKPLLPYFNTNASNEIIRHNRRIVQERYSLEAYGKRLLSIYQELAAISPEAPHFVDANRILGQFLQPKRFNLLRT